VSTEQDKVSEENGWKAGSTSSSYVISVWHKSIYKLNTHLQDLILICFDETTLNRQKYIKLLKQKTSIAALCPHSRLSKFMLNN